MPLYFSSSFSYIFRYISFFLPPVFPILWFSYSATLIFQNRYLTNFPLLLCCKWKTQIFLDQIWETESIFIQRLRFVSIVQGFSNKLSINMIMSEYCLPAKSWREVSTKAPPNPWRFTWVTNARIIVMYYSNLIPKQVKPYTDIIYVICFTVLLFFVCQAFVNPYMVFTDTKLID